MPVLAWPILYETVNTRLVRRPETLAKFKSIATGSETILLDDAPYREESLAGVVARWGDPRSLSLVDTVLCRIIEDVNVQVAALLTFDTKDFLNVCLQNNVELLNSD